MSAAGGPGSEPLPRRHQPLSWVIKMQGEMEKTLHNREQVFPF